MGVKGSSNKTIRVQDDTTDITVESKPVESKEIVNTKVDAHKKKRAKSLKKLEREKINALKAKEKRLIKNVDEFDHAELVTKIQSYASPLASKDLSKKIFSLLQTAVGHKCIVRGIKSCIMAATKGEEGIMVMAGDVTPAELITPMPTICKRAGIKYIFLPTQKMMGHDVKLPVTTSCILVKSIPAIFKKYNSVLKNLNKINYHD